MRIKRALISVYNKDGIELLAKELDSSGVEIWASSGTASYLKDRGIKVRDIEELTGFSKLLQGRVKTLHPMIFGGILADERNEHHIKDLQEYKINKFDLVVVNLYPFEEKVIYGNLPLTEAIEWIDIGGSALIRASSKNYENVVILIDPADYNEVIEYIKETSDVPLGYRRKLAKKAFQFSSYYDALMSSCYGEDDGDEFPQYLAIAFKKVSDLRYGENPHQKACTYKEVSYRGFSVLDAVQLQGKEMSFNNYIDVQAAFDIVNDFQDTACAIVKHTNPCGVAIADTVLNSFKLARETDPESAFGGIVAFNRCVDEVTASELSSLFLECIMAPEYTEGALEILKGKKNLRVLMLELKTGREIGWDMRRLKGGMLAQGWDNEITNEWECVTQRQPTEEEKEALQFAWIVVKHVKSNAIVFANRNRTLGIGAGQMSRVDSVRIAKKKARSSLVGAVAASDAFFPFKDNVEEIAEAGATAIIQPGGSIRDNEVIQEANKRNVTMIFTGMRHFKH